MSSSICERFERDGFVFNIPILPPAEVAHYSDVYERLEAEARHQGHAGRVTNRHLNDPDIWRLATDSRILELVEAAAGPDIVLLSSGFFCKRPSSTDQFVAWHQDTMYWGLEPPFAVTIWLAVDDVGVDNGCMRVIPGSHLHGLLPHTTSQQAGNILGHNQEIPKGQFDESTAVDFVMNAGCVSLHHGELIHGSNPNRSDRRRLGATLRYTIPGVRPVGEGAYAFNEKPILVRGVDNFRYLPMIDPPAFAVRTPTKTTR